MESYYDQEYFAWQKKIGELAVLCDAWKFSGFIGPDSVVLDFGCGGGYFLAGYHCKGKYGVEINPKAREIALRNGIVAVDSVEALPGNLRFDLIMSNHALEHVHNPLETLRSLRGRLKEDGKIVFYVPLKAWRNERTYDEKDVNQHLYCWTPLLLGNLFAIAGFKVERTCIVTHAWLPLSRYLGRMPKFLYHTFCYFWSILSGVRQTMIVARSNEVHRSQ
ncbi:MAG TPA: class I SAM-dependent methyltransferase [Verrucomicrobiae bacterium]|nr:class I SAM-dependent methyltransferase [Verrucomicrobiae bacterium]